MRLNSKLLRPFLPAGFPGHPSVMYNPAACAEIRRRRQQGTSYKILGRMFRASTLTIKFICEHEKEVAEKLREQPYARSMTEGALDRLWEDQWGKGKLLRREDVKAPGYYWIFGRDEPPSIVEIHLFPAPAEQRGHPSLKPTFIVLKCGCRDNRIPLLSKDLEDCLYLIGPISAPSMPRVYGKAKKTFLRVARAARAAGKSWEETFKAAKEAGYTGTLCGIERMFRGKGEQLRVP